MISLMRSAAAICLFFPPATTNAMTSRSRVVSGLLNKQAAAQLGISEVTLQIHRTNVMRKMEAASLADLVRMAGRLNIPASQTHYV